MKRALLAAAISVLVPSAFAQSGGMKGMEMNETKAAKDTMSHNGVGEVKSVDAKAGTVTLAHEPIQSLKWPAMTMKFKAADPKLLEKVSRGKKVEFTFVQKGKDYVITELK